MYFPNNWADTLPVQFSGGSVLIPRVICKIKIKQTTSEGHSSVLPDLFNSTLKHQQDTLIPRSH
ncbi:unnamed protein product [Periconia digitata]|uniref:Uncharacterized protein n=1 Tax=Periconia digitata TaxID=1303443 RepID=A0A9W4URB2_9PLEO|nr:unnamed protein product [Periconia digitata]